MPEDSKPAESGDTKEGKKEMIYHTGNLYQRYKRRKIASPEKAGERNKRREKTIVYKRR